MTSGRSNQATWWPLALVAVSSLALLALATLFVNGHHPRVANLTPTPARAAAVGASHSPALTQGQVHYVAS